MKINIFTQIQIATAVFFISVPTFALNWTVDSEVSYVRTYDGVNYSIGLSDQRCDNEKDYFQVYDRADNNTFFTIALSAMLAKKKVRISYQIDPNGVHCYVDGIWIKQ